ncbi:MAG: thiamine biosynthesis protein ThiF [Candidatus Cloacimonadota bacterium]|nr:MAG: thiamine biosynthesis protein ThiF [Candidatus Cloacimonadota bacterium]
MKKITYSQFFSKHDRKILPIIRKATVGIAGAGGLGSNIAFSLVRAGIGKLIISDFDKIEPSNLNRQQYFIEQIGMPKVKALRDNLRMINPFSACEIHEIKLNEENIPIIYKNVDIMVEAFDKAEMKQMLIESWLIRFPEIPLIVASGLAGFGDNEKIRTKNLGNLFVIGDETAELDDEISPMAPKVGIVANMQANLVLELLIKNSKR